MNKRLLAYCSLILGFCGVVNAAIPPTSDSLTVTLQKEVSKAFGGSRVQLELPVRWIKGDGVFIPGMTVSFLGEDGAGHAHFTMADSQGSESSEGWVTFSAWKPAKVALKRIHPGERINPESFFSKEVDISKGQAHEFRGVLLEANTDLNGLEATQSILEGQFLIAPAARKIPDVRRGDSVRVHLISGDMVLSTQGIAGEPGYISGQIRVLTGKTKRELLGRLESGGVVEVKL